MADLIFRAEAINALTDDNIELNLDSVYDGERHRTKRSSIRIIAQLPAVDAAPVVHGRWLEERPNTYTRKVKCSVCDGSAPFNCESTDYYGRNIHVDFVKTKYCPNCGAKMDDKQENNDGSTN